MLLAPIIVQHSDRIVMRFAASEWLMRSLQLTTLAARSMSEEKHAVICGFGRSGQYLARFMAHEGVGYVALDLDPDRVREATAAGEHVVYGNATRREMLIAAGVKRASVLVVTFSDLRAAENVLRQVREINPALPVVVRTIDEKDFGVLQLAGAAEVVPGNARILDDARLARADPRRRSDRCACSSGFARRAPRAIGRCAASFTAKAITTTRNMMRKRRVCAPSRSTTAPTPSASR